MAAQPTAPPEITPTTDAITGSDHENASEKFTSSPLASARTYLWHDLYLEAIFERDRARIAERIRDAGRALMHREHELCRISGSSAERESVVTALNCLEALRACIDIRESPKSHAPAYRATQRLGLRSAN
jgi:hypothetical protein